MVTASYLQTTFLISDMGFIKSWAVSNHKEFRFLWGRLAKTALVASAGQTAGLAQAPYSLMMDN